MAYQNNLRQISIILYRLKRNFGLALTLRKMLTNVNDVETGQISRTYQDTLINRAIVLPKKGLRDFAYDLSYIAANKNFTYGGFYDQNTRVIVIDTKDIPTGLAITESDHVVFETRRYEIKNVELAEHNKGYILIVREITSSDAE